MIVRIVLVPALFLRYALYGIGGVSDLLFRVPKHHTKFVLALFGARIGRECDIEAQLTIHNGNPRYENLVVGDRCHIGRLVFLDLAAPIEIGDEVTISMRATILTHTDVGRSPLGVHGFPRTVSPVKIEQGAYLGAGATVLQGVTIGRCAIVAAGALVNRSVEPHTLVAGVPARLIRRLPAGQTVSGGNA